MVTNHIGRFNEVTAETLKSLYQHFPAASYPTPTSVGLTKEEPVMVNGIEQASEDYQALSAELRRVIAWLIQEDYVCDRQYKYSASFVLTGKGLSALERIAPEYKAPSVIR